MGKNGPIREKLGKNLYHRGHRGSQGIFSRRIDADRFSRIIYAGSLEKSRKRRKDTAHGASRGVRENITGNRKSFQEEFLAFLKKKQRGLRRESHSRASVVSCAPLELDILLSLTHGLRRGLHSGAASRLCCRAPNRRLDTLGKLHEENGGHNQPLHPGLPEPHLNLDSSSLKS